jgi:prepilin-type processing-associated H-X9-DG protein
MNPPPSLPQPIDYASKVPRNPAATASLVCGLLFFLFPFVPGLLALYWGYKARRAASNLRIGGRRATWGIRLGWVNVLWSVVASVLVPLSIVRARHAAMQAACVANMQQIATAVRGYAIDWNCTPGSLDVLLSGITRTYVSGRVVRLPGYLTGPGVLDCPACSSDPAKPPVAMLLSGPTHYHILLPNPPVEGSAIQRLNRQVLLYEPLSNHDDGGANFLYFDGHVQHLEGAAARAMIASLAAHAPTAKPQSGQRAKAK